VTGYPNREHANADKVARRRALAALDDIEGEVAFLRKRVNGGLGDGDDTGTPAERAADVTRHLSVLGTLREVREWHAADEKEAAGNDDA
jgi:hypothetical protein